MAADRKYDPEGTRQAIMEAAQKLFVEKGVGRTSMTEIAKGAAVTKSLIHHHFGGKEALFVEVMKNAYETYLQAMLRIIRSRDDNNTLEAALRYNFEFHRQNPDMTRLMSWMHLEGASPKGPTYETVIHEGIERIRGGQRDGDFRSDVQAASIQTCFLLLSSAWFQRRWEFGSWMDDVVEESKKDDTFLEDIMKIFFEGVRPR